MLVPRSRMPLVLALGVAALAALAALAFALGSYPLGPADVVAVLWQGLRGEAGGDPAARAVLLELRGPRIAASMAVGATLAVAGAALQGVFRNPLVSPDILGVSSGCALGAVAAIILGWGPFALQASAFSGGLLAAGLVMSIGLRIRAADPVMTLVLAGVVVGSLLTAGVAFVKTVADPYNQLPAITFWLLGSFNAVLARDLAFALPTMMAAIAMLALVRWRIDVIGLPDDESRALGVNATQLRIAVIVAATLATSACVAIAGVIGWAGLVIPHAARLIAGAGFARALPLRAVLGAVFMLLVDTFCRSASQTEIPPGVVTALIGTPAFILLLAWSGRRA